MGRSDHGVNDPNGRQITFEKVWSPWPQSPNLKQCGCNRRGALRASAGEGGRSGLLAPVIEKRTLSRGAAEVLIEVKAAAVIPPM